MAGGRCWRPAHGPRGRGPGPRPPARAARPPAHGHRPTATGPRPPAHGHRHAHQGERIAASWPRDNARTSKGGPWPPARPDRGQLATAPGPRRPGHGTRGTAHASTGRASRPGSAGGRVRKLSGVRTSKGGRVRYRRKKTRHGGRVQGGQNRHAMPGPLQRWPARPAYARPCSRRRPGRR